MRITPQNIMSSSADSNVSETHKNNSVFKMLLKINDGKISLSDWQTLLETKAFIPTTYTEAHS